MGRAALLAPSRRPARARRGAAAPRDMAVVVGSGTGDVDTHREVAARLARVEGSRRVSPTVIPRLMASTVPANLATVLGATGPSFTAVAACAGGAYNLLLAAQLVEAGHVDAALAGGVDIADVHFHAGFDAMRAYTTAGQRPARAGLAPLRGRPCRLRLLRGRRGRGPRDPGRGRGPGRQHPRRPPRLRHVVGRDGQTWWPLRPRGPSSRCAGPSTTPGCAPEDVDYVNTHATSTPVGDVSEVRAMRRVFGGRHVAYSSTKGYTGHPVSAAGPIEAIFTLAMLRGGWIAPCVNAEPLDPELLDYPPVLRPESRPLRTALSNSFGFGGTNATLVLERP